MTRLIDADRLTDVVDEIDWYHLHDGRMVHGANSDTDQPWYKSDDIYKAIKDAPTVEAVPFEFIQQWISELDDFISRYGGVNKYDSLTEHYIEYTKALNQLMKRWIEHEQTD